MDHGKFMDNLSRIPGLSIPGVTKPLPQRTAAPDRAAAPVRTEQFERPAPRPAPRIERNPMSENDKKIFLNTLKVFFDNAKSEASLTESSDVFATLEGIVERNPGNMFLQKTFESLLEASNDFEHARGYLRMIIKNTAEYIKSM